MTPLKGSLRRVGTALMALLLISFGAANAQAQEKEVRKEVRVEMTGEGDGPGAPAFMGVVPRALDHVLRAALGYEEPGVLVAEIIPDGPAAKAGVKVGEILVKLDGTPVHDTERLMALMRGKKVGDKVDAVLYHLGKTRTVKLELAARPAPMKRKAIWIGGDEEGMVPGMGDDEMGSALDDAMQQVEIKLDGLDLNLEDLEGQLDSLDMEGAPGVKVKVLRLGEDATIN